MASQVRNIKINPSTNLSSLQQIVLEDLDKQMQQLKLNFHVIVDGASKYAIL